MSKIIHEKQLEHFLTYTKQQENVFKKDIFKLNTN
jgi:hypothetical protein